jgi:hypothetical protein
MELIPYLAGGSAIAALLLAVFFYRNVAAASPGDDRMIFLMTEIQKGARAFLKKEYTWVAFFVVAEDANPVCPAEVSASGDGGDFCMEEDFVWLSHSLSQLCLVGVSFDVRVLAN